jgi:thiol-disulfide isomerase/thioredoxin
MQSKTANIVIISVVVVAVVLLFVTIILAAVYGSKPQPKYIYIEKESSDDSGDNNDNSLQANTAYRYQRQHADKTPARAATVTELANEAEAQQLLDNTDVPALIMVYAEWCGFCKKMQPVLDELVTNGDASELGVEVYKLNNNVAGGLLEKYDITGFPALLCNFGESSKHMGYRDVEGVRNIIRMAPQKHSERRSALNTRLLQNQHNNDGQIPEIINEDDLLELLENTDTPVLAMVFAEWCGFCKKMQPVLDALMKDEATDDIIMVKINADNAKTLAAKYNVTGFPTMLSNFGDKKYVGYKDNEAI